MNNRVVIVLSW